MNRRTPGRGAGRASRLPLKPLLETWTPPFLWRSVAVGALAGLLAATIAVTPRPLLIWNVSESAPRGLYGVGGRGDLARGEMVAARVPLKWRALAGARRYIPVNVPLIKRVAARSGDRICSDNMGVRVNGVFAARRRHSDGAGRPIPSWSGCRRLKPGEFLLLMDDPDSFDGRYFGVTRQDDIVGKVELLWAR